MVHARERGEERKGRAKAFSHDLQSSIRRFSSGKEQKFIASTRGTRGYLKIGISPKIQEGRFREIKVVGFRRLPNPCITRLKVRDSSYLVLLSTFGSRK